MNIINRFAFFVFIVFLISVGLFFPQILDAVHGMSILEMMQQAIGFVLHVIVVSIAGYAVYFALNEIILPIVKTMKTKQRQIRRSIRGRRVHPQPVKQSAPRGTRGRDAGLLWIISQLAQHQQEEKKQMRRNSPPSDRIHWS